MSDTYILGHSPFEIGRLIEQAAMIRKTTERLVQWAGIERGMRVLDVGCGAGDVALLVRQLIGQAGSVVGIDRNAEVLALARERAKKLGYQQVTFTRASLDSFAPTELFDLVIGRNVLVHQQDPVTFLRTAVRLIRPGGVLALHETAADSPLCCLPHVALWQETVQQLRAALQAGIRHWDAGRRFVEHFASADLPEPQLFSETPLGGGSDAPHYAWLANLARSLLPLLEQLGLGTAESLGIETLEHRLRSAIIDARSQVEGPAQLCAWASI
jgi:ubiquinone/menaquinone biosynthesis C-methylase UbiE